MRHLALAVTVVFLSSISLSGQSDERLARARDRAGANDVSGLRRLLQEDPSLVRRTDAGVLPHWNWTLLHSATADLASLAVIAALIEAGADVNAKDNEGNTPLHFATKRNGREKLPAQDYEGIVRLLLDRKADVHVANIAGATPLHTACASRADPAAVELLIQAGAAVNRKALESAGGWTPLHGAAARGSADIIRVLLRHGADSKATDARGLTPFQVAQQGGFSDAAAALRTEAPATTPAAAPAVVPRSGNVSGAVPAPGAGGIVQGRVLWNGQPVAGATVFVSDNPPGSVRYGTVATDAEGRFVISGVPEGNRYVGVNGSPQIFALPNGATFTMTATPFTRDFSLCKGFNAVAPSENESVSPRPALRWEPFPDASHYVVVLQGGKMAVNRGPQDRGVTDTRMELDVDLPPGRYEWRVYAYSASGQNIGCSFGPRAFTVRP